MAIVDSEPVLAYYGSDSVDDGRCFEVAGEETTDRTVWPIYQARPEGISGYAETQFAEVLSLVQPRGLDIGAIDSSIRVAAAGGEAYNQGRNQLCSAHDLVLFGEDGSETTLVSDSGEVAVDAASDAGFAVGYFPSLAYNSGGTQGIIAYRDEHFGGIQSDDERRADLEAVLLDASGNRTQVLAIDPGRGAGRYSDAVFDANGTAYVAYVNDFEFDATSRGTLVARITGLQSGDTEAIEIARVGETTAEGPSIWIGADDRVRVAYYEESRGQVAIATLADEESFDTGWETVFVGAAGYNEGQDPAGASFEDGTIAVAYYRCGRVSSSTECDSREDGLVVAIRAPGEEEFEVELVDPGEDTGRCGAYAALTFDDAGDLFAGYLCQTLIEGRLEDRVHVAVF
ncbi:MAG: hypothetical protein AAF355_05305 [Myxococcota bacterium]